MARSIAIVALAVWLAISMLPLPVARTLAAPPEPERVFSSDEPVLPEPGARFAASRSRWDATHLERDGRERGDMREAARPEREIAGSVRPRGREAPVQLRQTAPESAAEPQENTIPDPGDGDPRKLQDAPRERQPASEREPRVSRGLRLWPMKAGTYSFSQAFGCVPQIAHFYRPGAGCPADAPVIHHGIDLAAPEGTPFYAAASGWVTESGYDREVGVANTRIIIQHEGRNEDFATEYLHWIASYVEVGDYVEAGEVIGEVGSVGYSTGPHLHFSVIDLNSGGNVDPVSWLPDDAGNEGYRGRTPNTKATMRLPAGTTAGVPEFADPSPPPPPVREDVPGSRVDQQGRDRSERQRKRDRKERRAERDAAGKDATAAEPATERSEKQGKNRERTRKRERDKSGRSTESSARGTSERDGKRKSKTFETPAEPPEKDRRNKRANKRDAPRDNAVDQRDSNQRKDDKKKEKRRDANDAAATDPGADGGEDGNAPDGGGENAGGSNSRKDGGRDRNRGNERPGREQETGQETGSDAKGSRREHDTDAADAASDASASEAAGEDGTRDEVAGAGDEASTKGRNRGDRSRSAFRSS